MRAGNRESERSTRRGTAHGLFLAAPFAALTGAFALGALLEPDPRGLGTHEQLGFAPCGFRDWLGRPCPTCGVTTSVVHAARGGLAESWSVQPSGLLLLAAIAALAVGAVRVHRRGGDLTEVVRRRGGTWLAAFAAALLSVWVLRGAGEPSPEAAPPPGQISPTSSPGSTTSSGS
ncbi:MAG: DUF2752 domain-containing protein [Planctomycetota bacterium]